MIVWSGRGFLTVLVLFALLFIGVAVFPKAYSDYAFVFTAFGTAWFSWYFGTKWNSGTARVLRDESTGEQVRLLKNHSLFWIPMQYWGGIFALLGIVILFQNSILFGVLATLLLGIPCYWPNRYKSPKAEKRQNRQALATLFERKRIEGRRNPRSHGHNETSGSNGKTNRQRRPQPFYAKVVLPMGRLSKAM